MTDDHDQCQERGQCWSSRSCLTPSRTEATCDCGALVRGALWPMASNGDSSLPWVERCDDCKVFADDEQAAIAVAEKVGGRVMFASLDGAMRDDRKGLALSPFVLVPEKPSARAELANDGLVRCSECRTDQFTYQENVPSERKMDRNEDGALVFWSCSREFDGDDDPGVVCENGHECDTTGIEVDWC